MEALDAPGTSGRASEYTNEAKEYWLHVDEKIGKTWYQRLVDLGFPDSNEIMAIGRRLVSAVRRDRVAEQVAAARRAQEEAERMRAEEVARLKDLSDVSWKKIRLSIKDSTRTKDVIKQINERRQSRNSLKDSKDKRKNSLLDAKETKSKRSNPRK